LFDGLLRFNSGEFEIRSRQLTLALSGDMLLGEPPPAVTAAAAVAAAAAAAAAAALVGDVPAISTGALVAGVLPTLLVLASDSTSTLDARLVAP
jgi:hypothetical protein